MSRRDVAAIPPAPTVNRTAVATFLLLAGMIVGITHLLLAWALVAAGVGVLTRLR